MGVKTVLHPPYSPDLAPCDFCLFTKLRSCRYETIEEMKEAVTKVIDTPTQEDVHGAFQKVLERYNKCIAFRGDCFEGGYSLMCVLSIKVPTRKKSGNLSYATRIFKIYMYIEDLAFNNQNWLACHKANQTKSINWPPRPLNISPIPKGNFSLVFGHDHSLLGNSVLKTNADVLINSAETNKYRL